MEQYRVNKVWVDEAHVWAETQNGWKANCPFSRWARLASATQDHSKEKCIFAVVKNKPY